MILFFPAYQEKYCYRHCQQFCNGNGKPYSVNPQNQRESQYYCDLEYQSPKEGYGCRHYAVAQGGKECGTKDIEPINQKGYRIQFEAVAGHFIERLVIPYEESG